MLKKAFRVTTAFGLLVAGYAAYAQVFALVARTYGLPRDTYTSGKPTPSKTARKAKELAVRAVGPGHWATAADLPITIYNADRGFWMYAPAYKRLDGGKVLEFAPFLLIWESRDGKSTKTVESKLARVELDRPFGLVTQPGAASTEKEGMKVVRARLEGDVVIRDDKGTVDQGDDLLITKLTHLLYDEAALTITSGSEVQIEEARNYLITGDGLLIKLRPKPDVPFGKANSSGFNGAQTAFLNKNVHVVVRDVGPTGVLPGSAVPADPKAKANANAPREPTPLDVRSDGPMQVDLAKPTTPVLVGPPAPEGPTYVHFARNVEVLRGRPDLPRDSLNCDNLHLTLVPADKSPATAAADAAKGKKREEPTDKVASRGDAKGPSPQGEPAPAGDSGSNLTLKRAVADGHNVRLASPGQGIKARCNELIHTKLLPVAPDETYLRGDATTRLIIEKEDVAAEGPDEGKVVGYTLIHTIDATIFDDGPANGTDDATIVARGPGDLESRRAPDQPVERTARWEDQLTFQSVPPRTTRPGEPPQPRKRLTLTGKPGFADLTAKATLDARDVLVVWLAPKTKDKDKDKVVDAAKTDAGVKPTGGGAFDIDELVALGDVQLTSPGKTLTARDRLDAVFESPTPTVVVDGKGPSAAGAPSTPVAKTTAEPAKTAPAAAPAETPPADRPAEPEARAIADRIWAKVLLKPAPEGTTKTGAAASPPPSPPAGGLFGGGPAGAGGSRADIDTVFLRGAVLVHQDPEAGKVRGTDVMGEAVDVFKTGENTSKFIVFQRIPPEPGKANAPTPDPGRPEGDAFEGAVAKALDRNDPFATLARIDTDDMIIRGQVIGLDQATDYAWVDGLGALTRLTARGLLSDKADPKPAEPKKAAAAAEPKKGPMTVSFARGMKFYGRSTDPWNRPAGKAEFYEDVHAWTDDGSLDCSEVMRVYLDRVVKLVRPPADPKAPGAAAPEPQADVALIECVHDVIAVNVKRDPATGDLVEKQRIVGPYLIYEKATGKFRVPGPGEVYLYQVAGQGGPAPPGAGPAEGNGNGNAHAGRVVRPTAGPRRDLDDGKSPVVGRHADAKPNAGVVDRGRPRAGRPQPQLELTQIDFGTEMHGRFGTGQAGDTTEPRFADFFGDVQVLRARVADSDTTIDQDDRPADTQSITSQILRVRSEPARDPKSPQRNLLRAWDEAYAVSEGKVIQADTITFDSLTGTFWAYGEDDKDVVIAEQTVFGQPGSFTQGRAAMYNTRTGEAQVVDPSSIAYVNRSTGERPYLVKPKKDDTKVKRPPHAKFRNLRGNVERWGFTGG